MKFMLPASFALIALVSWTNHCAGNPIPGQHYLCVLCLDDGHGNLIYAGPPPPPGGAPPPLGFPRPANFGAWFLPQQTIPQSPAAAYGPPRPIFDVENTIRPAQNFVHQGPPTTEPTHPKYTGPIVSKEETEALHAYAIAQQKELIRQQEAINAAGPAAMAPGGGADNFDDNQPSPVLGAPVQERPIVQHSYPLLGHQATQQKYTGPIVSEEETKRIHADSIARLEELIRQQDAINAAGPATMGPMTAGQAWVDNNYQQVTPANPIAPQLGQAAVAEWTGNFQQTVHTASSQKKVPEVSKQETEILHAEAISKLKEIIRQQEAINAAGPATMGPMKAEDDCGDGGAGQHASTGVSSSYGPSVVQAQQIPPAPATISHGGWTNAGGQAYSGAQSGGGSWGSGSQGWTSGQQPGPFVIVRGPEVSYGAPTQCCG